MFVTGYMFRINISLVGFVPLVNNSILGYYEVMNETEWLVTTDISYCSSDTLSSCVVVITQRGTLTLPHTGI